MRIDYFLLGLRLFGLNAFAANVLLACWMWSGEHYLSFALNILAAGYVGQACWPLWTRYSIFFRKRPRR